MTWRAEFEMLAAAGVVIWKGLTETELADVESIVDAHLPDDLRSFLAEGLPLGKGFPDWRQPDSDSIRDQLTWPFEGIAFDIEQNAFWMDAWGIRPPDFAEALSIARMQVDAAPRLIPIMGHRYLPAEPNRRPHRRRT